MAQKIQAAVGLLVVALLLPALWDGVSTALDLRRAAAFSSSLPQHQQPVALVRVVPMGLPDVRAQTCGRCHQEIYAEWSLSTHRHAYANDAQFMAELTKSRTQDGSGKPGDVGWMCINCHTPLVNQQAQLVVGLQDGALGKPVYVDNPLFDARMQEEAVTCATCHVRDGVVLGPFGNTSAPHATRKAPELLQAGVCLRCHQAEAVFETINLGCFFSTGREWQEGPFKDTPCQQCHMPVAQRKLAEDWDVPTRQTRRHWFGGSLIPKKPDHQAALAPLRAVFGDGIRVDAPTVANAGDDVARSKMADLVCPSSAGCQLVLVTWRNSNAGHRVPTGDPERSVRLELTATAPDGKVLAQTLAVAAQKFEWWPVVRQLDDTRFAPGESRVVGLLVPKLDVPVALRVTATKARMNEDAFEHHQLEGKSVRARVFHDSSWMLFPDGHLTNTPAAGQDATP